jgi:lipopolysaccharide/colanic/teichoic acid biosynthesis glycosyltransferase
MKLKQGGVFVSRFESIEQRKNRFNRSYPNIIAKSLYFFDFLYKRVFPKLPFFKKILGRLHYCGFDIVALKEFDDYNFFIVKKVRAPIFDEIPSYGAIFKQKRVGKDGRFIYVFKLRTMHPFAEHIHKYIYDNNKLGERGKIHEDYRITSWGRFFRKFWIDEIPMLINWYKGDLKLFGVRPLSEPFFQTYPEDLKKERIKYKPGLIPPYYADLPHSIEEVWESERRYLNKYRIHPMRTDLVYLLRALQNILFRHAKSV